jgi:gluconokinase
VVQEGLWLISWLLQFSLSASSLVEQPLILALDIGTSSVRAALYDSHAEPVPRASVKIERSLTVTPDGGAEIDADEAVEQVAAAIDALLKKTQRIKREIRYVASCAFWHSLVGIDARDRPTTKVFGWADTRSRAYSAVLKKRFDENTIHNRTGAHFHSSYWPAKLLWIRKEFPDSFAKTHRWLSFSDYLALKLFGTPVTSISMASGTGIFDIRNCTWDAEMVKYLRVKGKLIDPVDSSRTFTLNTKFAKRWPRLKRARWFPTIADGAADSIGSSCLTKSKAALMLGTSGAMRVAYKGQPPKNIPNGLWCYRIDRERVIIGGALSDGGNLYQWLIKNLKLPKDAEAQIAKRPRGAHGLTFLPFLAGERSTGYNEDARGAVIGLTSATTSVDMLQAALEAVADRFADISKRLSRVVALKEIVASGGALRESKVWKTIIEETLGHDLKLSGVEESSSRGAVLLALESQGKISSITSI